MNRRTLPLAGTVLGLPAFIVAPRVFASEGGARKFGLTQLRTGWMFLLMLVFPAGAFGWSRALGSLAGLLAGDGNAVVTTVNRLAPRGSKFTDVGQDIVLISSLAGRTTWRHHWRGPGPDFDGQVNALTFGANGDVIAGGTIDEPKEGDDFVVTRLDGRTGRRRWQAIVRGRAGKGGFEEADGLAIAPSGDVVAAGSVQETEGPGYYGNFAVVALDGGTGAERWRFVVDGAGTGWAGSVAVDADGDVVAAGVVGSDLPPDESVTVVKLTGASGTVVWQQQPAHVVHLNGMAMDRQGDVLLAVTADGSDGPGSEFGVLKLSGASGNTQWITRQSIDNQRWQSALHVVVDETDAIFAGGVTDDGSGTPGFDEGQVFTVVRLDPATGAAQSQYRIGGAGNGALRSGSRPRTWGDDPRRRPYKHSLHLRGWVRGGAGSCQRRTGVVPDLRTASSPHPPATCRVSTNTGRSLARQWTTTRYRTSPWMLPVGYSLPDTSSTGPGTS
jgi:hypothetical protein